MKRLIEVTTLQLLVIMGTAFIAYAQMTPGDQLLLSLLGGVLTGTGVGQTLAIVRYKC